MKVEVDVDVGRDALDGRWETWGSGLQHPTSPATGTTHD